MSDSPQKTPKQLSNTPLLVGKEMSSGLKERLKKCGRFYKSPCSNTREHVTQEDSTNPYMTPLRMKKNGLVKYQGSSISPDSGSVSSLKRLGTVVNDEINNEKEEMPFLKKQKLYKESNKHLQSNASPINKESSKKSSINSTAVGTTDIYATPKAINKKQLGKMSAFKCRLKSEVNHSNTDTSENETGVERDNTVVNSLGPFTGNFCENKSSNRSLGVTSQNTNVVESNEQSMLKNERRALLQAISEKEETLRKLKMVKIYRTKNDLIQLQALIDKWRSVAQTALEELMDSAPEPKPSLIQIIEHFQIDHKIVQYDSENESFI